MKRSPHITVVLCSLVFAGLLFGAAYSGFDTAVAGGGPVINARADSGGSSQAAAPRPSATERRAKVIRKPDPRQASLSPRTAKTNRVSVTAVAPTAPAEKPAVAPLKREAPAGERQGGDTCATATVIPSLPYTDIGTTVGYTHDYDAVCPYSGSTAPDVVYAYTPWVPGAVDITLCLDVSNYDTKLYVYADACIGGTEIACSDDACHSPEYPVNYQSWLVVALTPGTTYYIVVDGYGTASGNYQLNMEDIVFEPPYNDNCFDAVSFDLLPGMPVVFTDDNTGATVDCEPLSGGTYREAWFALTLPETMGVEVAYCGTTPVFYNAYTVMDAVCPCSGEWFVASSWDNTSCGDANWTLRWTGLPPGTYYWPLLTDSAGGHAEGPYTVTFTGTAFVPPEVDFFETAPFTTPMQTTCGAGDDCNLRPTEEHLYQVTIPYAGTWAFDLCASTYDTYLFVGTAPCTGNLGHDDDSCGAQSYLELTLAAGDYYLAVEGYDACGDYVLSVYESPDLPQLQCSPDALFAQPAHSPTEDWVAHASDEESGYVVYENYSVGEPISQISWWGLSVMWVEGWQPCDPTGMTFQIAFHPDGDGEPEYADKLYILDAEPTFINTGLLYDGCPLWQFVAPPLEPCCYVYDGWVSILSTASPGGCQFFWMSSPSGTAGSYQLQGEVLVQTGYEHAFCFDRGACSALIGACCMIDGTCVDGMTETDCTESGGGFRGFETLCEYVACEPCDVTASPEARMEGEPVCHDNYIDTYNGGCESDPPVFQSIECGSAVFGTSGTYFYEGVQRRDADWYILFADEPQTLTWSVWAEFPSEILILDGGDGCPGEVLATATGAPCEMAVITVAVESGTYWLGVQPSVLQGIPCSREYEATVTCGVFPGLGCETCPGDMNGDGVRDGLDIQGFAACYVAGPAVPADCVCADMDLNGVFEVNDVVNFVSRMLCQESACMVDQAFASTAVIDIEIFGYGQEVIPLGSCDDPDNTTVQVTSPPYQTGRTIDTAITEMHLEGTSSLFGPVIVRQRTGTVSPGVISNVQAGEMGDFLYGDSFFDVFVEIELPAMGGIVADTGGQPVPMQAMGITELPPVDRTFDSGPVSLPLYVGTEQVGVIRSAQHTPCPVYKCVYRVTCVAGACGACPVTVGTRCTKANCVMPNPTCAMGGNQTCGGKNCCITLVLEGCMKANLPPCPDGGYCPRCEPTIFPEDPTQCPVDDTRCPPTDTYCVSDPTRCPPISTECPDVPTECPEDLTYCPEVDTMCPDNDPTVCEFTVCPEMPTLCPLDPTVCPPTETVCMMEPTVCPEEPTACPEVPTACPEQSTQCPSFPTYCPPQETVCPEVETTCPPCACEITITDCPAAWLPEGRAYGTAVGTAGNSVTFTATVTKDAPRVVRFFLQYVSSEPGVCINYGGESTTTPDLKFIQTATVNPPAIFNAPSADGMTITTKNPVTSVTVTVTCYDWGAWGQIRACCMKDGACESYTDWKKIPRDDIPAGGNHIGDAWRPPLAANPALWDADDYPANMERNGDGFSFYEEYRGTMNGTSAAYVRHYRHDPTWKDLFLYDEHWLHLRGHAGHKYIFLTGMWISYLNGDPAALMNGPGYRAGNHRHVTWKAESHHIANQYALHVRRAALGGRGSWGIAKGDPTDAAPIGPPATAYQIWVDDAQVRTDIREAITDQGGNPNPGGAERAAYLDVSEREVTTTMTHEMSHGTDVEHHQRLGRDGKYGREYWGDIECVIRYDYDLVDRRNATHPNMFGIRTRATSGPGTLPPRFVFSNYTDKDVSDLTPVLNKFCTADSNCRGQIDVKDD